MVAAGGQLDGRASHAALTVAHMDQLGPFQWASEEKIGLELVEFGERPNHHARELGYLKRSVSEVQVNLIRTMQCFDGKRTEVLERVNHELPRNGTSMTQLLAAAEHDDARLQVGATWILKQWSDDDEPLVRESVASFVELLKDASTWEVQLHLLQILAAVPIPPRSRSKLKKVLPGLLTGENKLIRAWALSVIVAMADQDESSRRDAQARLDAGESDEAASVRARVRQLRKRYPWTTQSGRTG